MPLGYNLRVFASSMWHQGVRSKYKLAYWRFLGKVLRRWAFDDAKLWLAVLVLLSANHFVIYSKEVADELEQHVRELEPAEPQLRGMVPAQG
jgi:hypothetical protein